MFDFFARVKLFSHFILFASFISKLAVVLFCFRRIKFLHTIIFLQFIKLFQGHEVVNDVFM